LENRTTRKHGSPVALSVAAALLTLLGIWLLLSATTTTTTGGGRSEASVGVATTIIPAPDAGDDDAGGPPAVSKRFDAARALEHVDAMESYGPRRSGSAAERAAADYILEELRKTGYDAHTDSFDLPKGRHSLNVRATLHGTGPQTLILGAHMDSKAPSPGANDNLSGCAVLLEVARVLAEDGGAASVEFVFFGGEEMVDGNPDHHHYGSRAFVSGMSHAELASTAGMISVDMVGHGSYFAVRSMRRGPQSLQTMVLARAQDAGLPAKAVRDPGKYGWSDHEPFELAGIPATWIEWRQDPSYHSRGDTGSRLMAKRIQASGEFIADYLRGLSGSDLQMLQRSARIER